MGGRGHDVRVITVLCAAVVVFVTLVAPPGGAATTSARPRPPLDAAVSQDTIATTVCADGYAAPADQIPRRARRMVFASYGITPRDRGRYVIDLLVPRALGGSDGIGNLRAQLRREVVEKDAVEAALHQLVCAQHVDLVVAQRAITADWRTARQVADGAAEQRRAAVAAYLAEVARVEELERLTEFLESIPPPPPPPRPSAPAAPPQERIVAPNRNPVVGGPCPERGITSRTPIDGVETPVICTGPIGGAVVWTPY